jgi:nucleotide-binding universal stress UspA family protein
MFDTILVAVDGSERASQAASEAMELAMRDGAAFHGVYVVDTNLLGEPALSTAELSVDAVEDHGHKVLDELSQQANALDLSLITCVRHGSPKEEIISYAEEVSADLIILGAYGDNAGHRVGGVAEYVFQHAPQRVMKV